MYLFGLMDGDEDVRPFTNIDGLIAIAHHGEVTDALFNKPASQPKRGMAN